jgi:hypothetical protein
MIAIYLLSGITVGTVLNGGINNFKNKIHELSNADKITGGRVSSAKKTLANSMNNLKHGRYSGHIHTLLHCSECPYAFRCTKRKKGYCFYLIEDLKNDKSFRKIILEKRIKKNSNELIPFLVSKYALQKEYIEYLKNRFD